MSNLIKYFKREKKIQDIKLVMIKRLYSDMEEIKWYNEILHTTVC